MGGALLPLLMGMLPNLLGGSNTSSSPSTNSTATGPATLPSLPTLPTMPSANLPFDNLPPSPLSNSTTTQRPFPSTTYQTSKPNVLESYSAEMDDPGVACKPCTLRHVTTVTEAARTMAESSSPETRSHQAALIGAEVLVWEQYDLTPDKLARASADTREAVLSVKPDLDGIVSSLDLPNHKLLLSWGALMECRRFAEGRAPTDRDWDQVRIRLSDVYGCIGHLEDTDRSSIGARMDMLRDARHTLAHSDTLPTAQEIAIAEEKVGFVAVALTPDPTSARAQDIYHRAKSARDRFFKAALKHKSTSSAASTTTSQTRGSTATLPSRAYWEADTKVPDSFRPHNVGNVDLELLGATPPTEAAWKNLLLFAKDDRIIVRERQLPPEVEGGSLPAEKLVYVAPAETVEDSYGLQTLVHELAHVLLHNPKCLVHATPRKDYEDHYWNTTEELEADYTTLLFMSIMKLRIEFYSGKGEPSPQEKVLRREMRESLDEETYERVRWAAEVLSEAAKGDISAAVEQASSCPVREYSPKPGSIPAISFLGTAQENNPQGG